MVCILVTWVLLTDRHVPTVFGCRMTSSVAAWLLSGHSFFAMAAFCVPSFGKFATASGDGAGVFDTASVASENSTTASSGSTYVCAFPNCPYPRDLARCRQAQEESRCHACDRRRCSTMNPQCCYYRRAREAHDDAGLGDNVPHYRQINAVCVADGVRVTGWQQNEWWRKHRQVDIVVDHGVYRLGRASSDQCNCLIDTLRQKLEVICNVAYVRSRLNEKLPTIIPGDFLELGEHAAAIVALLDEADLGGKKKWSTARNCRIVCLDLTNIGNGDVVGEGGVNFYIARLDRVHFVPLIRRLDDTQATVAIAASTTAASAPLENPSESRDGEGQATIAHACSLLTITSVRKLAPLEPDTRSPVKCVLDGRTAAAGWYSACVIISHHYLSTYNYWRC